MQHRVTPLVAGSLASLIVALAASAQTVAAQVIQIEGKRIRTDKPGWAGEVSASLQLVQNTSQVVDFSTNLQLQYKTGRHLVLALSTLDLIRGDAKYFDNRGFQHLRHNYKLTDWFVWETFGQVQYDRPMLIELRGLVGLGPRVKVYAHPKGRLYVAALAMYEHERLTDGSPFRRDVRISGYISFTIEPDERLRLVSTTYLQPRIDCVSDYRVSSDSTFAAGLTENLSLFATFTLLHDTRPPVGVRTTIYTLKNGLAYRF